MKADGPAVWIVEELMMNSTMATKMTNMSNEFRTLPSRTGAICSETNVRSSAALAPTAAAPEDCIPLHPLRWRGSPRPGQAAPTSADTARTLVPGIPVVEAQRIDAFGVLPPDQANDPFRVCLRALALCDPALQDRPQRAAKQEGPQEVELGQAEGIGGVELLGERRQLERLGHQPAGARPQIVQRAPQVEMDVREHRSEVAGLAMVGIAVQEDHVHRQPLELPDQVSEQRGVGQVHREVRIAEAGMDLQGEPSLSGQARARPDAEPQQDLIGEP